MLFEAEQSIYTMNAQILELKRAQQVNAEAECVISDL